MAKKRRKGKKKVYFFTFIITLLVTILVFGSAATIYLKSKEARYKKEMQLAIENENDNNKNKKKSKKVLSKKVDLNTLEGLVEASSRVNILLLGTDGGRADTIILASYDPDNHYLDFVTIPRDTYNKVPGKIYLGQDKINAVFGFPEGEGGGKGMKSEVSQILGVPIHYYVTADYRSIYSIVNAIGGVEVYVDQYMDYDDPYADPELHIHFSVGTHNLNGQQAMEYLRWRKNNNAGEGAGDVPRTQRQIDFVKRIIKKTITSFKYGDVIKTCYEYVDTDLSMSEIIDYSTTLIGFDPDRDIETNLLPGETFYDGLSYYGHDEELTKEMMMKIYRKGLVKEDTTKSDKKDKDESDKKTIEKETDEKNDNNMERDEEINFDNL